MYRSASSAHNLHNCRYEQFSVQKRHKSLIISKVTSHDWKFQIVWVQTLRQNCQHCICCTVLDILVENNNFRFASCDCYGTLLHRHPQSASVQNSGYATWVPVLKFKGRCGRKAAAPVVFGVHDSIRPLCRTGLASAHIFLSQAKSRSRTDLIPQTTSRLNSFSTHLQMVDYWIEKTAKLACTMRNVHQVYGKEYNSNDVITRKQYTARS